MNAIRFTIILSFLFMTQYIPTTTCFEYKEMHPHFFSNHVMEQIALGKREAAIFSPSGGILDLAQVDVQSIQDPTGSSYKIQKFGDFFASNLLEKSLKPSKFNSPKIIQPMLCNIQIEGGICLANNKNERNKYSHQNGLIGFWNFDDEILVDLSGSKQTIKGDIKAGPGVNSRGGSAYFNGNNYIWTEHQDSYNSKELTLSFWIYLIAKNQNKKTEMFCPIVLKGEDDFSKSQFRRFPGIYIHEHTGKLRLYTSLVSPERFKDGIWTETIGRVPLQRWTHVSVTISTTKLQIYLNGILDSLQSLEGRKLKTNKDKLYLGSHPAYSNACKVAFYLDDLKIYDEVLPIFAIQAEAYGALGSFAPNQIMIGCMECNQKKAEQSCIKNYHICTDVELLSGGYQAIRIMGWNLENKNVIRDTKKKDYDKSKGRAFCCRNYLN